MRISASADHLKQAHRKVTNFRLDESGSDAYRADFQNQNPDKVRELREGEQRRRDRKQNAPTETDQGELDFADEEEEES